jgi:hypothetical protein
MSEPAPPRAPVPFTQILDDALKLSRRHLKSILLPVAVPVAISAGLLPIAQGVMYSGMPMGQGSVLNPAVLMGAGALFLAALLLLMVVQYVASVAVMVAACDVVAGRPVSMSRAWRFPLRLATMGTSFLAGLIYVVGFLLCCLPGLYVMLVLSFIVPVMVLESTFGPDALRRSNALASYNPTGAFTADPRVKVFVVIVVSALVGMALSFVVQFPMMIVQQLFMFHEMSSGGDKNLGLMMARVSWLQVPAQMVGAAVQLLTRLYMAFGLALLYFDARNRKEGTDLEAAIADLSADGPDASPA